MQNNLLAASAIKNTWFIANGKYSVMVLGIKLSLQIACNWIDSTDYGSIKCKIFHTCQWLGTT